MLSAAFVMKFFVPWVLMYYAPQRAEIWGQLPIFQPSDVLVAFRGGEHDCGTTTVLLLFFFHFHINRGQTISFLTYQDIKHMQCSWQTHSTQAQLMGSKQRDAIDVRRAKEQLVVMGVPNRLNVYRTADHDDMINWKFFTIQIIGVNTTKEIKIWTKGEKIEMNSMTISV